MTTTQQTERFTTLPDEATLAATVVALEEHGFSVEVVDDLDAARRAALALIPHGSSVMTNTSVTLQETGIDEAINGSGPYRSARNPDCLARPSSVLRTGPLSQTWSRFEPTDRVQ